ncbi:MAG: hypothetical protein ACKO5R_15490 [Planctomycetaceae bacterium]
MGINRIVMHNGVVWWLPPLRPRGGRMTGPAPAEGFIPLGSPDFPGIDAILGHPGSEDGPEGDRPEGRATDADDPPAAADGFEPAA